MSRLYFPEARIVIRAIVENFSKSTNQLDFPITPKSVQITRNGYKQPDSWSIEFDGKDFPIPPSLLRAAQVVIYLYDKKGLEVNRALLGTAERAAIVGLVDSVEANFSGSGRTVKLDGQDMTALFSEHIFQKRRNFTNMRLDKALDELRKEVDIRNVMKITTEIPFADTKLPIIGKSVSRTNKKGFPAKRGENYWNIMYDLAVKHGFILFVRDFEIVLATPQAIIDKSTRAADRTFKLTWGKNLEEITVTRSMGKQRIPQIEIISYDEDQRKPLVGRFPKNRQKVTTGVGTKRNEVVTGVLYGIKDIETLERLAEIRYNLTARTEQTVEFSTRELRDEDERNLIFLKAGDAFFISFNPFNSEELRKVPKGQRAQFLVNRGWTTQAANVFANHFDQLHTFRSPFYVREANIDWAHDKGLSIDASVINFVNKKGTQEEGEVKDTAESV